MTEIMPVPRNLSFTVLPAESLWPTVLLHASHNVFVRSISHAATVNGPYAQYYQLFLLFVLPIKIRMS